MQPPSPTSTSLVNVEQTVPGVHLARLATQGCRELLDLRDYLDQLDREERLEMTDCLEHRSVYVYSSINLALYFL